MHGYGNSFKEIEAIIAKTTAAVLLQQQRFLTCPHSTALTPPFVKPYSELGQVTDEDFKSPFIPSPHYPVSLISFPSF